MKHRWNCKKSSFCVMLYPQSPWHLPIFWFNTARQQKHQKPWAFFGDGLCGCWNWVDLPWSLPQLRTSELLLALAAWRPRISTSRCNLSSLYLLSYCKGKIDRLYRSDHIGSIYLSVWCFSFMEQFINVPYYIISHLCLYLYVFPLSLSWCVYLFLSVWLLQPLQAPDCWDSNSWARCLKVRMSWSRSHSKRSICLRLVGLCELVNQTTLAENRKWSYFFTEKYGKQKMTWNNHWNNHWIWAAEVLLPASLARHRHAQHLMRPKAVHQLRFLQQLTGIRNINLIDEISWNPNDLH